MRFDNPQLAAAMLDTKIDRINHAKADLREACLHSEGCEDDCFACKRVFVEKPYTEPPAQPEHNNTCQHCLGPVLTTTGIDPLRCHACRDLLESSDPWHQTWHS